MSINENVIIISSDSEDTDIEELRKLAINSMIKEEIRDSYISDICDDNYKDPVNYQINVYSSFLTRKRSSSIISNEDSKRPKIKEKADSVENIIKDGILEVFDINTVLNYSKTDNSFNLLKEEELKNKLLKALRNKKELNQSNNIILPKSNSVTDISHEEALYESDDNFDIYTHAILPEVITDPNVLKYHNLITEAKLSIEEVVKSINTISASIQEKLIKSKKITTQIENLKLQKTELHREISVNRRKVLDLQKIRKQKSTELINYELLKRKYSENQLSSVYRNVEFIDSISTVSSDSKPSYYEIDCNHLICPAWLNNICTNKSCIYQHPKLKFPPKPTRRNPASCKIKENDKVFLKEMNSSGFICKVKCEACSINIFMSNSHIKEDSYCKSCCQQLVTLRNPIDILNQLTLIWHHFYKRYIKSKNLPFNNRDASILQNLYKCTDAMRAKLTTVVNLPWKLFISTGYHIILTFDYHDDGGGVDDNNETRKIDDLIAFLKSVDYNFQFVLFVCKRVSSFPIEKLYQLLIDTMFHLINNCSIMRISHYSGIPLILEQFSICGRNNNFGTTIYLNQLFQWLQLSIKLSNQLIIDWLVTAILREIIGPEFVPQITLSMHELGFGDKFWQDRKETINRIANLFPSFLQSSSSSSSYSYSYSSSLLPTVDNSSYPPLILIKYVILTYFFTGNEEDALELCRNVIDRGGYFFVILNCKLSLNYNIPFNNSSSSSSVFTSDTSNGEKLALIEYTFNKSVWLVVNRSIKSSVKLLETVPNILYKLSIPIKNSKQALDLLQSFLEIRQIPPPSATAASAAGTASGIIDNHNHKPISNLSESQIKLIRNQSAVWLCYINLALLIATRLEDRWVVLDQILDCDRIIANMNPEHLIRVAQFIIIQFGKLCVVTRPGSANGAPGSANGAPGSANGAPGSANGAPGSANGAPGSARQYLSNLRRVFLVLFLDNNNKSFQFGHFLDAFQAIEFDKLVNNNNTVEQEEETSLEEEQQQQEDYQLQTWLFLIDFCIERFPQESSDQFLVIVSQRLAQTAANHHRHHSDRQVLRHIIMCYPIRCVEVWVNYIELLLDLAGSTAGTAGTAGARCVPVYELIDACNMAVSQFPRSRLLWQYYHDSAVRCDDEELLKTIRGNAVKLGFQLSQR